MEHGCQRPLRDELADLELQLEITAAAGRPSPWVERLRARVRELRERMDAGVSSPRGDTIGRIGRINCRT